MYLSLMQADAQPVATAAATLYVLLVLGVLSAGFVVFILAVSGAFESKEQKRERAKKAEERWRLRQEEERKAQERGRELAPYVPPLILNRRKVELEEAGRELGERKMSPALRVLRELQLAEKQARLKAMTTPMSVEETEELKFQLSVMSEQIEKQKKKLGAMDRLKSKL